MFITWSKMIKYPIFSPTPNHQRLTIGSQFADKKKRHSSYEVGHIKKGMSDSNNSINFHLLHPASNFLVKYTNKYYKTSQKRPPQKCNYPKKL